MNTLRILIVEDEAVAALNIQKILEEKGFSVTGIAYSADEAVAFTDVLLPDLILMDIKLEGGRDGIAACQEIQSRHRIPVIYITAYSDEATLGRAKETHPHGFVLKPINERELLSVIEIAVYKHTMEKRLADSEERLRLIYNSMIEGLATHEILYDESGAAKDYRITDVNPAFEALTGLGREHVVGGLGSAIYGTPSPPYLDIFALVASTGNPATFESKFPRTDRFFDLSVFSPSRGTFVTLFTDITDRRGAREQIRRQNEELEGANRQLQGAMEELEERNAEFETQNRQLAEAQDELLRSEERYRTIVDDQLEFIIRSLPDGTITFVNRAFCEFYGKTADEVSGTSFHKYIVEEDFPRIIRDISFISPATPVVLSEFRARSGRQETIWVEGNTRGIFDTDGVLLEFQAVGRDITRQKISEMALQESELRFRILHNASFGGIGVHDKGIILEANQGLTDISGYSYDELIGMNGLELISPEWRELVMKRIVEGYELPYDAVGLRKDGGTYPLQIQGKPIPNQGKTVRVTEFRDITERKTADDALRKSEERYRLLVETMNDGMVMVDGDWMVIYANPKMCALIGYGAHDMIGKRLDFFFDERNRVILSAQVEQRQRGNSQAYEIEWMLRDGGTIVTKVSPQPLFDSGGIFIGSFAVVSDLTEAKRTQDLIMQSEKMMTVGGLAAGMAHEINNPLGVILQGIQAMEMRLSPDLEKNREAALDAGLDFTAMRTYLERRSIYDYLSDMRDAASRAAQIVSTMLKFSRRSSTRKSRENLNLLIDETLELAAKDYDLKKKYDFRKIEIVREFALDLPPVTCNGGEIEQVILNLVRNSAQAMAGAAINSEPRIAVRTRREGAMAVIEVEDNGPGMNEDVCRRLFEPFFTTKGSEGGTGLGLSVSYFIVTTIHNGQLTVQSQPGRGATFTISLPVE